MPEAPDGISYVFGYGSLVAMGDEVALGDRRWAAGPGPLARPPPLLGSGDEQLGGEPSGEALRRPRDRRPAAHPGRLSRHRPAPQARLSTVSQSRSTPAVWPNSTCARSTTCESMSPQPSSRLRRGLCSPTAPPRRHASAAAAATPSARVFVSRDYVAAVRRAFAALGKEQLKEYDRTTEPLDFPERHLRLVYPPPAQGDSERD